MAEVNINIQGTGGLDKLNANLEKGANSVNNLKKELREVTLQLQGLDAGSEEFVKLSEKAGELRDKIKDTSESINANAGPAFERLGNQFGLVSSKLATLDFGGAAESMKGLASAIGSVKFSDLTDGLKQFGSTIASVGKAMLTNPIFLIGAAIAAAYVAITQYQEMQREKLNAFIDQVDARIKSYKREQEIALASAASDAEKMYEISKTYREREIKDVKEQIDRLRSLNLTRAGLSDEQKGKLQELTDKYLDLLKEQEVAEINHTNAISAERKKQLDDYQNFIGGVNDRYKKATLSGREYELYQARQQFREDIKRLNDTRDENANYQKDLLKLTEIFKLQEREINNKYDKEESAKRKEQSEKRKEERKKQEAESAEERAKRLADEAALFDALFKLEQENIEKKKNAAFLANQQRIEIEDEQYALEQELNTNKMQQEIDALVIQYDKMFEIAEGNAELEKQLKEKLEKDKFEITEKYANQEMQRRLKIANDVFNSLAQLNDTFGAKEGSRAKRSFQINKSLGIAQATMNTWAAANAILKDETYVGPERFFAVAAAITAGLANVGKIAKTQFNPGGGGGGSNGGGGGGASMPSMTQVGGGNNNQPSFNPLNTSFLQNQPQQQPLQAFVLTTQVNSGLEAQARIREQTTL